VSNKTTSGGGVATKTTSDKDNHNAAMSDGNIAWNTDIATNTASDGDAKTTT
jgi:hypothetical protein